MSNHVEQKQELTAPEFNVKHWVDASGNKTEQIKLSDFKGKFNVLFSKLVPKLS